MMANFVWWLTFLLCSKNCTGNLVLFLWLSENIYTLPLFFDILQFLGITFVNICTGLGVQWICSFIHPWKNSFTCDPFSSVSLFRTPSSSSLSFLSLHIFIYLFFYLGSFLDSSPFVELLISATVFVTCVYLFLHWLFFSAN
jgi:hypothetical protein